MEKKPIDRNEDLHSEDLKEIIAKPPSWLLEKGISAIMATILIILSLSFFIRYPEVVTVSMKFNTSDSPKALLSKVNASIVRVLVKEGDWVIKNTDVAYLECIADHAQTIRILNQLKKIRKIPIGTVDFSQVISPTELELGELQNSYQSFYFSYLSFKRFSFKANRRKELLNSKQKTTFIAEYLNEEQKVILALNTFIVEAENWKKQFVITSPSNGFLIFGDFIQENQIVKIGEKLFFINPNNDDYFGEMLIPQTYYSKVKKGQEVLIKVRSFPYQEYGYLKGKITYLSSIPINDSAFFSKVTLSRVPQDSLIKLNPGIIAEAEIITQDQSIFRRIWLNLTRTLRL